MSCTAGDCDDTRDFSNFIMNSFGTTASTEGFDTVVQNVTVPKLFLTTTVQPETDFTTPESYDYENGWTEWGPWRLCTKTCGEGHRERARYCPIGGCPGGAVQDEPCHLGDCPEMSGWSMWSECSESCGKGAFRIRTNSCEKPSWDGKICDEVRNMTEILEEKQFCSESVCPSWGGWSIWSVCDYPGLLI